MRKTVLFLNAAAVCLLAGCGQRSAEDGVLGNGNKYVDPFIGTGFHGHTFPGATRPFAMVQVSPDTHIMGWDASSGYHYDDKEVYGFSHTHLSGTGIGDLGDVSCFLSQVPTPLLLSGNCVKTPRKPFQDIMPCVWTTSA